MRTTIDLPDDLFRRAKATAALRGISLKQLVAELLEKEIPGNGDSVSRVVRELPQTIPASRGLEFRYVSNSELMNALDEDDEAA